MATNIQFVNHLIQEYLTASPDERLRDLMKAAPRDLGSGTQDRPAIRRVYKLLEAIEKNRNWLLEEFASDAWNFDQLSLFDNEND